MRMTLSGAFQPRESSQPPEALQTTQSSETTPVTLPVIEELPILIAEE